MAVFVPLSQDGPVYFYSKSANIAELFVGAYQSSCPDQLENIGRMLMQQLLEVKFLAHVLIF